MKRTELYKDASTDAIMTFEEVKDAYAKAKNSDLPIDDDTMYLIIMENLVQNGGNIILINENADSTLKWCNDYSEYKEADRFLSKEEKETSIKNIYLSILHGDFLHKEIVGELERETDSDSRELLNRLLELVKEWKN